MRKWMQTGKKTLSVIMAIMMVLTAWVWVAPTEASAATMGYYDVTVKINTAGPQVDGGHIVVWYYPLNESKTGFDTTNTTSKYNIQASLKDVANGEHTYSQEVPGFPWRLELKIDDNNWFNNATMEVLQFKIGTKEVVSSSIGSFHNSICYFDYNGTYTGIDEDGDGDAGSDDDGLTGRGFTWGLPAPDGNNVIEYSDVADMICPEGNDKATQTVKIKVNDQYGVPLYNPKWSVKGSVCGTTGISVTSTTTASESTVITLTNAANVSGTTNTQTGTIIADWGTGSLSDTFKITDSYYTAIFNYQVQNDDNITSSQKTETRNGYHGVTITAPTAPQYYDQDYLKTFSKWNPDFSSTITKDVTYTAVYNQQFIEADYSEVNEAIAAVNAVKATWGEKYDARFTYASRVAVDSAINAVVTGLGRTQQTTVDGYAQAINEALAKLEPNKYDVIFLDGNGAIIVYEKGVEFESSLTPPEFPEDQKSYYDATNHYTYVGWDTNEYTSVIDDLVISPVYTAEAHDFESESVTSTCVQAGTTKHTCKTCGYTYYDGGDQLGDHVWEDDFTVDLEPTCVLAGSKSIHCTLCDAQKDITVVEPKGHNWESYSVAVNPTCTNIGVSTRVCAEEDCRFCEHLVIEPLNHSYEKTTVAPTCTTKGYDEYICQNGGCGHSYRDNYTDVVAHTYGEWETVSEALCGVDGVKKQTCTECGYINIGTIDALEHNIGDWVTVVESTCTGKGYKTKTCSLCGNVIEEQWLDSLGHNYVAKTVVAPTCTSKGYTIEECDRDGCGAQRVVDEKEALNHAWTSTTHAADCTHSAYIEHICANDPAHNYIEYVSGSVALGHDFNGTETVINAATCETDGEKTVQCTRCDATTTVVIPHLGHTWGDWTVTKEATNTTPGEMTRTCSNGCEQKVAIPAGGHEFDNGTVKAEATCKATGTMVYKCTAHTDCGITLEVEIPVKQHTIAQREIEATCTSVGTVEAYCTVCNDVFSREEIPVKAHSFVAEQPSVAPTCTTSGYTVYACTCGESYNVYDADKPATGHIWGDAPTATEAATCEKDGSETYECENCDKTNVVVIPKLGHSYSTSTVVQEQTCVDAEQTKYTCACGAAYTAVTKEAKGHTFGNWEEVTPATSDKYGVQKRSCACGTVEYGLIAPIGNHIFVEKVEKEPTCTTEGEKSFTCSEHTDCSANYTEVIPATGHTQKLEYVAPTCTQDGSTKIVCSVASCGAELETKAIPAIGYHNFSDEGVIDEATCEKDGSITYTCLEADCSATKVVTLPAKNHNLTTTVNNAKCEEAGSVVTTCSECEYKKETVIPATGHTWGETPVETKNATCEENGSETYKCQNCEKTTVVVVPKLDHDWGEWEVTQASTNTEKGKLTRVCKTNSEHKQEVEIPAGGHSLVVDTEKSTDATCTAEGSLVYKCENHADCGITVTVTTEKIQHTLETKTVKDVSCTENGKVETRCTECNTLLVETTIPAKGHAYNTSSVTTEPGCESEGVRTYYCACGATKTEAIPATGHSLTTVVEDAKCEETGSVVTSCACGYTETTVLAAKGHIWGENPTATEDATCEKDGSETYKCENCDKTNVVIIPKSGHSYGEWVKTDATNDTDGSWYHKCSTCDKEETLVIPKGGHKFEEDATQYVAPTCEAKGKRVYKCTAHDNCIASVTVELDYAQHTVAYKETQATCTAGGTVEAYCTVCNKGFGEKATPAKAHNPVAGTPVAPTCTTSGYTPYACECGTFSYNEYDADKPATGHNFVASVTDGAGCTTEGLMTYTCACGESYTETIPATGHNYSTVEIAQAQTCVAVEKTKYTCDCGDSYTAITKEAKGHTFGNWEEVTPATADEYGVQKRSCACGTVEYGLIAPIGNHIFVEKVEKEPTCTTEGEKSFTCSVHTDCSANYTEVIPATGHTQKLEYVAPTCTQKGASKVVCETCGTVIINTEIPVKGHAYNTSSVTTEPGCESVGVRTFTCTCGASFTEELPAKGHNLTTTVTDATCTKEGSVVTTCNNCSTYKETQTLAQKNHNWNDGEETVAPGCESDGTKNYTCTLCGAEKTSAIPAKGHSYGNWTVTPSTNDAPGSVSRVCTCGKTETVEIPAGGHSLVVDTEKSTDATCTAEGSLVYKCENHADCGITVTVTTEKIQHTLVHTEQQATCTAAGSVVTKCEKCDTVTYTTVIPAKGHAYNTSSVTTDPGCESEGVRTYYCACGATKTEAIPATGHSYKTTITPATCTTAGSVVTECTVCKADSVKTTTALPAMGHDFSGTENVIRTATCETDGEKTVQCTRCDVTATVILPKSGHSYGEWIKTDATNDTDGSWHHKCSTCDKEETLVIPKGGHKFEEDATQYVAPTCEAKGKRVYKCTAHDNCIASVTVELDYTQHTVTKDNVDATCTDNGYVKTYCSVCDKEFNNVEIPATLHNYVGAETEPASCTREGLMTYTCSKCDDSYTKPIPMVQHKYAVKENVEATCTASGYTVYKCETCESEYQLITAPAKEHSYTETVSSSTCTKGGVVTLECACGDKIETAVPAMGHNYLKISSTTATCDAAATETYKCSNCDATYTVSVGEKATEHEFGEWTTVVEATYTSIGYETRSCNVCGFVEVNTIRETGEHEFTVATEDRKEATCEEAGYIVYACATNHNCGLTSKEILPALGHNETVTTVDATCEGEGSVTTTCSRCDYSNVETIPALGHSYGEGEVTPATCKDEGKIVYTCTVCDGTHTSIIATNSNAHQYETTVNAATCTELGSVVVKCKLCEVEKTIATLPKLEHTWSVYKTEAATCEADGTTYYKCSCSATKEVVIAKLGHNMAASTSVDATCTENGYTPYICTNENCTYSYNVYNASAKAHNYVQVEGSSTATCTNSGTVTLRCSDCDKEITATVPELGHDWGEWSTSKNPTAAEEGEKTRSCKRDGCNATETVTLPALGHEMIKDDSASTAATCTSEGTDIYVCKTHTDCGYTYSVKTAKLAHTYGEGVATEKATCTADGVMTYTCACGATKTQIIPKTGHTLITEVTDASCLVEGSVVTSCACGYKIETNLGYGAHKLTVVRESEPTCEADGIINIKCSENGCTHIASTITIPATGHDFSGEESNIIEATCETAGSKDVKCVHCDAKTTVDIPVKGHSYTALGSFGGTCTTSGYTVFVCGNCGVSYSRLDSQPNGHSWKEGVVKTPATCEADGIMLVECNNCDASYEKTISKLGHSWSAWTTTKYPTTTEEGLMSRTCIRGGCGATETAVIPALGGGNVTYTVTFVAEGEVVAVQTVNHGGNATAPVISKAADANGHYSYIWDTDFTNVTDNLTVTAIFTPESHTYGAWVTDRESTCQVNGSQHRSCTVCGYTETGALVLADHNYSVVVDEKAPTCTENGYKDVVCSVCGKAEKQTIKRLGHVMTYHERVYETCDTDGLLAHYSCSRCGKNFEDRLGNYEMSKVVVNKKYHTLVIVEGFAPTCTSDGATTYKHCTTCGMTETSVPIPALGHIDENADHYCDRCSSAYLEGGEIVCTCNCHKTGFINELIYKILRFFWQLLGKNKTCACGAVHY